MLIDPSNWNQYWEYWDPFVNSQASWSITTDFQQQMVVYTHKLDLPLLIESAGYDPATTNHDHKPNQPYGSSGWLTIILTTWFPMNPDCALSIQLITVTNPFDIHQLTIIHHWLLHPAIGGHPLTIIKSDHPPAAREAPSGKVWGWGHVGSTRRIASLGRAAWWAPLSDWWLLIKNDIFLLMIEYYWWVLMNGYWLMVDHGSSYWLS